MPRGLVCLGGYLFSGASVPEPSMVGRNCKKTQKSSAVTSFTNSYSFYREECSTKGGASDGSCASGFGVCCVCKYLKL